MCRDLTSHNDQVKMKVNTANIRPLAVTLEVSAVWLGLLECHVRIQYIWVVCICLVLGRLRMRYGVHFKFIQQPVFTFDYGFSTYTITIQHTTQ